MSGLEHTVPEGFKKTEVGIYPETWEVKTLAEIANIERGKFSARPRNDPKYFGGTIPFIQTGDITRSNGRDVSYSQTLNEKGLSVSRLFPENSLYFTIAANIGDVAIVNYQSACPDSLVVFKEKKSVEKEWLYHALADKKAEFEVIATSNAQLNINLEKLNPYKLCVPPKEEQTAIANALSDVDALLTELEKLIAKKQAIKTATMQQLLTGKTRLPQYATYTEGEKQGQPKGTKPSELGEIPEDWKVQTVDEQLKLLTDFEANGSFESVAQNVSIKDNDGYAWYVRATDLENSSSLSKVKYVDAKSYSFLKKTSLYGDELLITKRGEIGKVYFFEMKTEHATLAPNMYLLKLNENVCGKFLYYFFKSDIGQKLLKKNNASTSLGALYKDDVKSMLIALPSELEEQTAISTILSDMDNEIQTLEQRLAKTRQIKQGMMQQLLTGRTRLPFKRLETEQDGGS